MDEGGPRASRPAVGGGLAVLCEMMAARTGAVVGVSAADLIGQFKVDYAVIGASAIESDGALLDFSI